MILDVLGRVLSTNGLITAFVFVGALVWLSHLISNKLSTVLPSPSRLDWWWRGTEVW